MKKEVFLAITIGFILGLIITVGIWTANKSLKQLPALATSTPTPEVSTSPAPTAPVTPAITNTQSGFPLTLSSPDDEAITNQSTVTIRGATQANAVVAIVSESGEQILLADSSGNFTADVGLEGGYNVISVTAYNKDGKNSNISLTVTYTTAQI